MRDPDQIDFSPLDPSRTKARWEALVQATLARAHPLATVHPLWGALASRGRVALALAASLALLAWLPSFFDGARNERLTDAATELATWASQGEIPVGENIFTTFGAGASHVSE